MAPPLRKSRAQRLAAAGITPESLASDAKTAVMPSPLFRPVTKAALVKRQRERDYFSEYVEDAGGDIVVSGVRASRYEDLKEHAPLRYPDESVIQPYFVFLASSLSNNKGGAITSGTLRTHAVTFMSI